MDWIDTKEFLPGNAVDDIWAYDAIEGYGPKRLKRLKNSPKNAPWMIVGRTPATFMDLRSYFTHWAPYDIDDRPVWPIEDGGE